MNIAMIPDAKQSIASMVDITERVKAEKALRDSEERSRQFVKTITKDWVSSPKSTTRLAISRRRRAPLKKALRFGSAF